MQCSATVKSSRVAQKQFVVWLEANPQVIRKREGDRDRDSDGGESNHHGNGGAAVATTADVHAPAGTDGGTGKNCVGENAAAAAAGITPEAADERLGKTLLHIAMKHAAPPGTVTTVLNAWPGAAKALDQYGNTPLHLGMRSKAPPGSVKAVLDAHPAASKTKNKSGNTPLQLGTENEASVGKLEIRLNPLEIRSNPLEIRITPSHATLLNHVLTSMLLRVRRPYVGAILAMLEAWPAGAKAIDEDGNTPLHYLMSQRAKGDEVRTVLDYYPGATAVEDDGGNTPLRRGLRTEAPVDSLAMLLGPALLMQQFGLSSNSCAEDVSGVDTLPLQQRQQREKKSVFDAAGVQAELKMISTISKASRKTGGARGALRRAQQGECGAWLTLAIDELFRIASITGNGGGRGCGGHGEQNAVNGNGALESSSAVAAKANAQAQAQAQARGEGTAGSTAAVASLVTSRFELMVSNHMVQLEAEAANEDIDRDASGCGTAAPAPAPAPLPYAPATLEVRVAPIVQVLNICLHTSMQFASPSLGDTLDFAAYHQMYVQPAVALIRFEFEAVLATVAADPDRCRAVVVARANEDKKVYEGAFNAYAAAIEEIDNVFSPGSDDEAKDSDGDVDQNREAKEGALAPASASASASASAKVLAGRDDSLSYANMLEAGEALRAGCELTVAEIKLMRVLKVPAIDKQPESELLPLVFAVRKNMRSFARAVDGVVAHASAALASPVHDETPPPPTTTADAPPATAAIASTSSSSTTSTRISINGGGGGGGRPSSSASMKSPGMPPNNTDPTAPQVMYRKNGQTKLPFRMIEKALTQGEY